MKKNIYLFLFALLFIHTYSPNNVLAQCNDYLIWQDEFNGSALDMSRWSMQTGNGTNYGAVAGWGNEEKQYYTDRPENVRVENGSLILEAKAENFNGHGYTSGRITTKEKASWKYGKFEARIKVPSADLVWPAFWMLPEGNVSWPKDGEIDIMEMKNENPTTFQGTIHYLNGYHRHLARYYGSETPYSNRFHTYIVVWEPNLITWYIDGAWVGNVKPEDIGTANWPFEDNPFYLILNVATGGNFTGSTANPNPATYPTKMEVDYVRVYGSPSNVIVEGQDKVLENDAVVYEVAPNAGNSYSWTVPAGATILSGQGTSKIKVKWGGNSGNVQVSVTATKSGCAGTYNYSLPVTVIPFTCTTTFEDYDAVRGSEYFSSTGLVYPNAYSLSANPDNTGINTSATCLRYDRWAGARYDELKINLPLDNADNYRTKSKLLKIDVYTDAPIGTTINMQLAHGRIAGKAWPEGRHSNFTVKTTKQNEWETLTFNFVNIPSWTVHGDSVNQIIIQPNADSNTGGTYYFDNIRRSGTTPTTSSISGSSAVCESSTNVSYSVTNSSGSTYQWTVPGSVNIASGVGTNSVKLDFSTTGGTVSVVETNDAGCVGSTQNKVVSIDSKGTTANAGEDQTIDANSTILEANTPSVGTGKWTLVSGSGSFNSTTSPTATVSSIVNSTNVYRWTITNGSCSTYDDVKITYTSATGIRPYSQVYAIEVYPNPSKERLTIMVKHPENNRMNIYVKDIQGKEVLLIKDANTNEPVIVDNALSPGIYLGEVQIGEERSNFRIIKN